MSLISLKGVTRGVGVSAEREARVSGLRRVSAPLSSLWRGKFDAAPTPRITVPHPENHCAPSELWEEYLRQSEHSVSIAIITIVSRDSSRAKIRHEGALLPDIKDLFQETFKNKSWPLPNTC